MFRLFIDDERDPTDVSCIVARTSAEAIDACITRGCLPDEIMFDHDLGGDDTAMVFIEWMTNALIDKRYVLPYWFIFSVHSQNPIWAERITGYMNNVIKHLHKYIMNIKPRNYNHKILTRCKCSVHGKTKKAQRRLDKIKFQKEYHA